MKEQKLRCIITAFISGASIFSSTYTSDNHAIGLFLGIAVFSGLISICMAIIE